LELIFFLLTLLLLLDVNDVEDCRMESRLLKAAWISSKFSSKFSCRSSLAMTFRSLLSSEDMSSFYCGSNYF
jgi:hypothetical protein